MLTQEYCHHINGPAISGPGGPFMFDIIGPGRTTYVVINGPPGPLMPEHKWSY